jgi:hypothetical protein
VRVITYHVFGFWASQLTPFLLSFIAGGVSFSLAQVLLPHATVFGISASGFSAPQDHKDGRGVSAAIFTAADAESSRIAYQPQPQSDSPAASEMRMAEAAEVDDDAREQSTKTAMRLGAIATGVSVAAPGSQAAAAPPPPCPQR